MSDEGYRIENAKCVEERPKAIKVEAPDFDTFQWIPKSVVHDDSEVYKDGDTGTLVVKEWFAEQEGWI